MNNPTIKELQDKEKFELIAELNHKQIKVFVINQLSSGGQIVKWFMIYQIVMLAFGLILIIWGTAQSFKGIYEPLCYILAALLFSVTFLIVIHELLHGIAIKFTGAKKVNYGAYLKKFIFYAEADRHILNRKQFTFVALIPLVVVKFVTIIGMLLFYPHPVFYSLGFVMCAHSLFCAGDIGLLSLFYQNEDSQIYTFDVKSEKKCYYFRRKP